jgi:integrase
VEHGALWQDHGLVFPSGIGTPLLCGNVNRAFKAALRRAGLPEIRFHDLRYSCATLLLRQGVNL